MRNLEYNSSDRTPISLCLPMSQINNWPWIRVAELQGKEGGGRKLAPQTAGA